MDKGFDVVAVGGGFAGLVVANRCAQLGLRAAVLEQQTDERYICNSRICTGVSHILFHDMDTPAENLATFIASANAGRADSRLIDVFAKNSGRAVDWLVAEGIRFVRINTSRKLKNLMLAPPRRFKEGLDWEGRGGDYTLRTLEANLVKRGGALMRGTKVAGLVVENGVCIGVDVERDGTKERIHARAVVLADGGFSANVEMIAKYITPRADRLLIRSAKSACGDGLRMAEAIGAALTGFGEFYGHPMHREALDNEKLWPFPMMDPLTVAAVVVGPDGRRFADEGRGGIVTANDIAHLSDPLTATLIFDDEIWNGAGKEVGGPNPLMMSAGGTLYQADTIAALAAKVSLPPDALAQTVAAYNEAIAQGRGETLDPPRTGALVAPTPLRKPPFYAVPLVSGITGTMGGVAIDPECRVLRPDTSAIPGLYAAGMTVAGLEGGPKVAYMGGLSKAFIFGLLAAEAIARDVAADAKPVRAAG